LSREDLIEETVRRLGVEMVPQGDLPNVPDIRLEEIEFIRASDMPEQVKNYASGMSDSLP
jgi:hypothetical protein